MAVDRDVARHLAVLCLGMAAAACSTDDSLASCDAEPATTPREALDAFYDSCAGLRPDRVHGPQDADEGSSRYASHAEVVEFTIERDDQTRFVLVGREQPSSPWRVLTDDGAEGTGP